MNIVTDNTNVISALHEKIDELEKELKVNNLRQQAKGLTDCSEQLLVEAEAIPLGLEHPVRGSNIYNWQTHFARELRYRSNKLSNQAQELKEKDNE